MDITEEYEDVLQNLESPIISIFRQYPSLVDWEVKRALEATIEHYRAEYANRPPKNKHLSDIEQKLTHALVTVCEWRLGRTGIESVLTLNEHFTFQLKQDAPKNTSEELQKCLKRIIKSVDRWHREGGKQGYLNFSQQFFP
ncbi:hypothetical protein [Endozoicomonas sp. Mp262]|uniref:hypothetical protein n=1 Tax=Endozoicomonas sp. Mp262 TaxID=2919499 RepID=UPI0021DB3618